MLQNVIEKNMRISGINLYKKICHDCKIIFFCNPEVPPCSIMRLKNKDSGCHCPVCSEEWNEHPCYKKYVQPKNEKWRQFYVLNKI